MDKTTTLEYKRLTNYLLELGIEKVGHTGKTYLAHLVGLYRMMEERGCTPELCRAGMFHSIYGTQVFQGFKLSLEQRQQVCELIGERAERLAYLNCAIDRETFDRAQEQSAPPYRFLDRFENKEVALLREDFDDLSRIHLYDWLEQAPRSSFGWDYRRTAYRKMADRLGDRAIEAYNRVFAQESRS
jgi:hypothetical protein